MTDTSVPIDTDMLTFAIKAIEQITEEQREQWGKVLLPSMSTIVGLRDQIAGPPDRMAPPVQLAFVCYIDENNFPVMKTIAVETVPAIKALTDYMEKHI